MCITYILCPSSRILDIQSTNSPDLCRILLLNKTLKKVEAVKIHYIRVFDYTIRVERNYKLRAKKVLVYRKVVFFYQC